MKKVFALVLALVLSLGLAACGGGSDGGDSAPEDANVLLTDVMQKIRSEVQLPDMLDLTADNLPDYFGLDMAQIADYAVCVNANGYEKEEVVLLRAASEADVQPICDALNTSLANAAAEMQNYLPEQYTLVKNSSVKTNGLYIALFVSENSQQIQQIWNGYLNGSIK